MWRLRPRIQGTSCGPQPSLDTLEPQLPGKANGWAGLSPAVLRITPERMWEYGQQGDPLAKVNFSSLRAFQKGSKETDYPSPASEPAPCGQEILALQGPQSQTLNQLWPLHPSCLPMGHTFKVYFEICKCPLR